MRKNAWKKIMEIAALMFIGAAFLFTGTYVVAHAQEPIKKVSTCENKTECTQTSVSKEGSYIREKSDAGEPPIYLQAIMARDKETYDKEKKQYYIATFETGAEMIMGDVPDMTAIQLYLCYGFLLLFWFILAIVLLITYIVLFIHNFLFGGIFQEICTLLINLINNWIFQWNIGFQGFGWKLLLILFIVVFGSLVIRSMKGNVSFGQTLRSIASAFTLMILIGFTAQHITSFTNVIDGFTSKIADQISMSTAGENIDNVPSSIRAKSLIYELTEVQPYMMRYFGAMNEAQITEKIVKTDRIGQEKLSGYDRFWRLWNGYDYGWDSGTEPAKLRAAKVEACRNPGSNEIECPEGGEPNGLRSIITRNNWGGALFSLLLMTLMILPQTLMLQFFLFVLLFFFGVLRGIVFVRPAFAFFEMAKAFFQQSFHVIGEYFNSLFKWMIISNLALGIFNVILLLMMKTYIEVAKISAMLTFGVSVIWCIIGVAMWIYKDRIFVFLQQALRALGGLALAGMTDMHSNPFESLADFGNNMKEAFDQSFGPESRKGSGSSKLDTEDPIETKESDEEKRKARYIDERDDVYREEDYIKAPKKESADASVHTESDSQDTDTRETESYIDNGEDKINDYLDDSGTKFTDEIENEGNNTVVDERNDVYREEDTVQSLNDTQPYVDTYDEDVYREEDTTQSLNDPQPYVDTYEDDVYREKGIDMGEHSDNHTPEIDQYVDVVHQEGEERVFNTNTNEPEVGFSDLEHDIFPEVETEQAIINESEEIFADTSKGDETNG